MRPKVDLRFSGLATSVNPFSAAPELSCAILDNCLLRNKDLIEPFRGYSASSANPDGAIARTFPWQARIMAIAASGSLRDFSDGTGWSSAYSQPSSNNWPSQSTFAAPDASNPVRAAFASKSIFFTTSAGVKALDGLGNSIQDAGIPAPTIVSGILTVGGGWLNGNCAYRAVLGRRDANNNLILSAPSQSFLVTNGGGATVTLNIALPTNANGATFVQLYRTLQVASGSPGDEMYLVQEVLLSTLTAFNATYGIYTLPIDSLSDNNGVGSSFFGTPLYTNPDQGGGIGSANSLPPLARDLCLYNGNLLYANTTERHSILLRLIGTGGLVSGTSTITIGGVAYKAAASTSASASPPTFQLFTGGTPAQNIDQTAQALCYVVNEKNFATGGGIQAVYQSTPDTQPGLMLFQETGIGGNSFTISVGQNGQLCWSPDLSLSSITLTSNNNRQPARFWWSADNEPWAVPADNWEQVGAADQDILRVILVRQTVFIFKKDGLYTLTGNSPANYLITPFDPVLVLLAPETAVVVGNQIFCLTNRGYVSVSESGITPSLSGAIERDINFAEFTYTQYSTLSFGVPYENDGVAFLALPTSNVATSSAQQYAFNQGNPSWSRLLVPGATHGCYDPARQALCWAVGSTLYEERKSFTGADQQWPSLTGTAGATTNSNTVVVTGATVVPGDLLTQSGHTFVVLAVNGTTCTIDGTYSFSNASVVVSKAIACHVRFLPWTGGDPTILKRFESALITFLRGSFENLTVGFNSELTPTFTSKTLAGPNAAGLGGQDSEVALFLAKATIDQSVGACAMLGLDILIQQAKAFWQLAAVRYTFDEDTIDSVR